MGCEWNGGICPADRFPFLGNGRGAAGRKEQSSKTLRGAVPFRGVVRGGRYAQPPAIVWQSSGLAKPLQDNNLRREFLKNPHSPGRAVVQGRTFERSGPPLPGPLPLKHGGEGEDGFVARFQPNWPRPRGRMACRFGNRRHGRFGNLRHVIRLGRAVLREETLGDQDHLSPALSPILNGGEGEDAVSVR
jgi:hypothetical protein